MSQFVFLGAGSAFTRQLLVDCLHDIDSDRLDVARGTAEHVARRFGKPLDVVATLDRREALAGADAVVATITIPTQVFMIPTYVRFARLGLLGGHAAPPKVAAQCRRRRGDSAACRLLRRGPAPLHRCHDPLRRKG